MVETFGVPGVVLAGGLAQRMGGGDKSLRELGGQTILTRIIARLEPQCECLILSANGDPLGAFCVLACLSLPMGCAIIRDRSLVSWPGSTGPRPTAPKRNGSSALRGTVRSCLTTWSRDCIRPCPSKALNLQLPPPEDGPIL